MAPDLGLLEEMLLHSRGRVVDALAYSPSVFGCDGKLLVTGGQLLARCSF